MDRPTKAIYNVLLVPDRAFLGGVCRVVLHLWLGLPKVGVGASVLFSSSDDGSADMVAEWFSHDTHRVSQTDLGAGNLFRRFTLAARAFSRAPTGAVNLHFNTLEGTSLVPVLAARLAHRRVILTYHHLGPRTQIRGRRAAAIRLTLRLASDVIVSTPLLEERVRQVLPSARPHVVPLGVDVPSGTYDRRALRERFGVPEEAFVVGHLSRLLSGKGLPKVVLAFKQLQARCPDAWLLACGTPDRDTQELTNLLRQELPNRSRLLGFVADQHEVLACCDVLAVPSRWEGFGLVYVEAAMHRIPRIGSRMGGVPFVIEDGVDGFLIEPDDIDALIDRIVRLYENPTLRAEMGQNAYIRAMAEFTAEQMARSYKRVLELAN